MKIFNLGHISEISLFKRRLTAYAAQFSLACVLDSCNLPAACGYKNYEFLGAWGAKEVRSAGIGSGFFDGLEEFARGKWVFGYLGYDLKNELEALQSANTDALQFPEACLFVPEVIVWIKDDTLFIEADGEEETVFKAITAQALLPASEVTFETAPKAHTSREKYLQAIATIREHLAAGDIYEMNYCIEFNAAAQVSSAFSLYESLIERSPAPFSACLKLGDYSIISASPERFLVKKDRQLVSQPIKGTAPRGRDKTSDDLLKKQLQESLKEKAENVMIVDLVRNDLSRVCKPGTVKVEELFGIYSFTQVHQMISTVSGEMLPAYTASDALQYAFPMGSMTGAPKIRAMEIIEELEDTKRGPFSGALGYITPQGDFDFNVLIRSIYYNEASQQLKFNAGGAITFDSDAEKEYEECLLKLKTIQELLGVS